MVPYFHVMNNQELKMCLPKWRDHTETQDYARLCGERCPDNPRCSGTPVISVSATDCTPMSDPEPELLPSPALPRFLIHRNLKR